VIPEMNIKTCVLHVKQNIQTKFGKEAADAFSKTASETSADVFYQQLGSFAVKFVFVFNFYPNC
jgi:hypothetical protein